MWYVSKNYHIFSWGSNNQRKKVLQWLTVGIVSLAIKTFTLHISRQSLMFWVKFSKLWKTFVKFLEKTWLDSTTWKVSKYGAFSSPYFPAFGLNTDLKKVRIWTHFKQCSFSVKFQKWEKFQWLWQNISEEFLTLLIKLIETHVTLQTSSKKLFI